MSGGVSDSRFHMWRAIFAMAHADHRVTAEERAFMEQYLRTVPFNEEQRRVIVNDMVDAQDVQEMFDKISAQEDRGEFFQFARALVWCDGDMDEQEESIKRQVLEGHMYRLSADSLIQEIKQSRAAYAKQVKQEEAAHAAAAESIVGLGAFLRGMARVR